MFGHFALGWNFKASHNVRPLKPLQNGFLSFFESFIGSGHLHQEGKTF